jgi:hypothetical protein
MATPGRDAVHAAVAAPLWNSRVGVVARPGADLPAAPASPSLLTDPHTTETTR